LVVFGRGEPSYPTVDQTAPPENLPKESARVADAPNHSQVAEATANNGEYGVYAGVELPQYNGHTHKLVDLGKRLGRSTDQNIDPIFVALQRCAKAGLSAERTKASILRLLSAKANGKLESRQPLNLVGHKGWTPVSDDEAREEIAATTRKRDAPRQTANGIRIDPGLLERQRRWRESQGEGDPC
jgi:hypothetical protein